MNNPTQPSPTMNSFDWYAKAADAIVARQFSSGPHLTIPECIAFLAIMDTAQATLAAKDAEIAEAWNDNQTLREQRNDAITRAEKAEKELAEAINSDCESMAMFRRVRDERDILREEIKHIKAWANAKADEVVALERNLYTGDDDEKKWLRAEVKRLKDQIGYIEAGEHPDEQNPRAQTWLQERKNWAAEVTRLHAEVERLKELNANQHFDLKWVQDELAEIRQTTMTTKFKTDDDIRDYLSDAFSEDEETLSKVLIADGHAEACLGITHSSPIRLVYSIPRVIDGLMKRDGMSYEDAVEFAEFNIFCAYMGEYMPLFVDEPFSS